LLSSLVTLCCVQVVCDLIEEEAEMLGGSEHVMLAGFSQGGALALHIAVHSGIQ
jgi:predicted esterase